MASNSKVSSAICPEFELVQMLCLSRLSANLIKIRLKQKRLYMLRTRSNTVFSAFNASNSEVNSPIWPEFELVRDFITALVTCKFEYDSIKSQALSSGQQFLHYKSMGKYFVAQG